MREWLESAARDVDESEGDLEERNGDGVCHGGDKEEESEKLIKMTQIYWAQVISAQRSHPPFYL